MAKYEIDLNGNPFSEFAQGEEKIRVTKLLTNNWHTEQDVFRISKVKNSKPKHSVDITEVNFKKIYKASKDLPNYTFEIGGAIESVEGPFIIVDIYDNSLLYTVGLGRTAPIRLGYKLDEGEKYIHKDKFELALHNKLKGRDWIIWENGDFFLLFHFEDKVYKKIKFDRNFNPASFYPSSPIVGNPEYIVKPYQIDKAIFIEDVTYNDSPQALDSEERDLNNPYQSYNIPFNSEDPRFAILNQYIFNKYPNDFVSSQWSTSTWADKFNKEMDREIGWFNSKYDLIQPLKEFNYSPFRTSIISFDNIEMYVSLFEKKADEIWTCCNKTLEEFIYPGKYKHEKQFLHISIKDRKSSDEYKEYINPSPLKEGYLKLKNSPSSNFELVKDRIKPIHEFDEPMIYCLYRELKDDEVEDRLALDFKPRFKQNDKVELKESQWEDITDHIETIDNSKLTLDEQYKIMEDIIKDDSLLQNAELKIENNKLMLNKNLSYRNRIYYITKVVFRDGYFLYYGYTPQNIKDDKYFYVSDIEVKCKID